MSILGWRAIYTDGTQRTSVANTWASLTSNQLQHVLVYHSSTYTTQESDGYDDQGNPVAPVEKEYHHLDHLHKLMYEDKVCDRIWYDPQADKFDAGVIADVPSHVTSSYVKRIGAMDDDAWWAMYNTTKETRVAP